MTKTITVPSGIEYISDYLTQFPPNCIFNKGKTGCGGTSIALKNEQNYIIAVPFINLATNKAEQSGGKAFSFTGSTQISSLKEYLQNDTNPKKILVTYDSLEKLIGHTGTSGYHLLVDEYHLLFKHYAFRKPAIDLVLKHFKSFESYVFMTATPLGDDFLLEELKDIPIVNVEWQEKYQVTVQSIKCRHNVKHTAAYIIKQYLSGNVQGNAYIYVNSIVFIRELVKYCSLTDETARAIWADNESETGLKKSTALDAPKKINFLTSTCFEGLDIFDPEGKTFIVSDHTKPHTLLDIATSFQQIAGRIRDSKYKYKITHIYTTTKEDPAITYDEYKKSVHKELQNAERTITFLNQVSEDHRQTLKWDHVYVTQRKNGELAINPNLVKLDLYNFRITKHLYNRKITLSEETELYGFSVKEYDSHISHDPDFDTQALDEDIMEETFQETVKRLKAADYKPGILSTAYITALFKYPFLEEAIRKIGYQGIEKLKYNEARINKRLVATSDKDTHNKILQLLDGERLVKPGSFVPAATLKGIFSKIYEEIGFGGSPKGSNIKEYYDVKDTTYTIGGKPVKGYAIKARKIFSDKVHNFLESE